MRNQSDFNPEVFQPHPLARNAHVQTLLGRFVRDLDGVRYERVRLDTPDDDFIDLDFADTREHPSSSIGDTAPILLLLHGLEGSAQAVYAGELYRSALADGFRCIGMNFRTCSGEMNRTPRFYHMGATDDVHLVYTWVRKRFPQAAIVLVGVSLGGNILLKYLGEQGEKLADHVQAAAAISPPFVATGRQPLNDGLIGKVYGEYLLRKLREKVRLKAALIREIGIDPEAGIHAQTIRAFDDSITAPLHGFRDAADYYAQCNSINFLPAIRIPTLLVRSLDDPFFNRDIPYAVIDSNPYLYGSFPEHGGHVGFIEGLPPLRTENWAKRQVLRFFATEMSRTL